METPSPTPKGRRTSVFPTTSGPSIENSATSSRPSAPCPGHVAAKSTTTSCIAGGKPALKVSWQVTGICQDDYATAHPIVVETDKSKADRGTQAFVPASSSVQSMTVAPVQACREPDRAGGATYPDPSHPSVGLVADSGG